MFPQVWQRVVCDRYRSVAASASGYECYEIAGETYPGMIRRTGSIVHGLLYFDVGSQDLGALDFFEGMEYRRDEIAVTLESGDTLVAYTYIYLLTEKLLESKWRADSFQVTRFLSTYCRDKLGG